VTELREVKVYVHVNATFDADGRMVPKYLFFDGHRYQIDKVLDIRQAAAMKAGGQGDRYTIIINNKQIYLFFERSTEPYKGNIGRWFVERKYDLMELF
jgi:hypothetical protein